MSDAAGNSWDSAAVPAARAGVRTKLTSVAVEADVFTRLRRTLLRNIIRQALAASRLRASLAAILTLFLWAGLFVLFVLGFEFLDDAIREPVTHDETVPAPCTASFLLR